VIVFSLTFTNYVLNNAISEYLIVSWRKLVHGDYDERRPPGNKTPARTTQGTHHISGNVGRAGIRAKFVFKAGRIT
jgi:hypothetical protein